MPRTMPIEEAQTRLLEILNEMDPGENLELTLQEELVAIVTKPARTTWPCEAGTAKDRNLWMADDFDAPLQDFAEYME